jgi:hypothetical protein
MLLKLEKIKKVWCFLNKGARAFLSCATKNRYLAMWNFLSDLLTEICLKIFNKIIWLFL